MPNSSEISFPLPMARSSSQGRHYNVVGGGSEVSEDYPIQDELPAWYECDVSRGSSESMASKPMECGI